MVEVCGWTLRSSVSIGGKAEILEENADEIGTDAFARRAGFNRHCDGLRVKARQQGKCSGSQESPTKGTHGITEMNCERNWPHDITGRR